MVGRLSLRRALIFAASALLLTLSSAAFAPVFADTLNLSGGVPGVACASATVASGSASFSCPPSPLAGVLTSTATGNLSTGVFGATTTVSGVSFTTGGSTSANIFVTYDFAVTGVTNGTAQFDISAPGIITCSGCAGGAGQSAALFIDGSGESINGGALGPATLVGLANGANNLAVDTSVANGTAQLFFGLELVAGCDGGPGYTGPACTSSVDFLDPLSITGASVFDANGNLVSGASLVSDSGFNPNAGSPVAAAEPPGLLLLAVGLLILICATKLKNRLRLVARA
jgi:hypothetical protein